MIVISFLLVIVAAVTLAIGIIQNVLEFVWASIVSCVLAIIFLGIGVLQRRAARPATPTRDQGYGPGAAPEVSGAGWQPREPSPAAVGEEPGIAGARPAPRRWGGPEPAAAQRPVEPSGEAPTTGGIGVDRPASAWRAASTTEPIAPPEDARPEPPPRRPARKATAKKAAGRRAPTKKAAAARAKKAARAPAKKATRAPARKATRKATKKAVAGTSGATAIAELSQVRGLGPAKARALLDRFGSLEAIRDAHVDELVQVRGVGETTARAIHRQLSSS